MKKSIFGKIAFGVAGLCLAVTSLFAFTGCDNYLPPELEVDRDCWDKYSSEYYQNEEINGFGVFISYRNDKTNEYDNFCLEDKPEVLKDFNTSTLGIHTAKICYKGLTTEVKYNVVAQPTLQEYYDSQCKNKVNNNMNSVYAKETHNQNNDTTEYYVEANKKCQKTVTYDEDDEYTVHNLWYNYSANNTLEDKYTCTSDDGGNILSAVHSFKSTILIGNYIENFMKNLYYVGAANNYTVSAKFKHFVNSSVGIGNCVLVSITTPTYTETYDKTTNCLKITRDFHNGQISTLCVYSHNYTNGETDVPALPNVQWVEE